MDHLLIRGGRPLAGRVAVGGAKNAALPIMAAALMLDGPARLQSVPELADVATQAAVLRSLGMSVERVGDGLTLSTHDASPCTAGAELVRRMRASVCVLGPLLAKRGRAVVALPGGCALGDRPIDLHLKGLAALGADIRVERGRVVATAKRLRGAEIDLAGPRGSTVTGTANVLAAAALAVGRTVIRNAAREPEIADLARFLVAAGAKIDGVGPGTLEVTGTLEITGVPGLGGVTHRVIPDRIEAATLIFAAAITGGNITLDRVPAADLKTVLATFAAAGGRFAVDGDALRVEPCCGLRAVDVTAAPFPGFPTDLQAPWTALMTRAAGVSRVTDAVFPDRFLHLTELARLGANVRREGNRLFVTAGPLRGADVVASDLRAGAALVLAALAAEGTTIIRRPDHLDRGYERLEEKLAALGADITRRWNEPGVETTPRW